MITQFVGVVVSPTEYDRASDCRNVGQQGCIVRVVRNFTMHCCPAISTFWAI